MVFWSLLDSMVNMAKYGYRKISEDGCNSKKVSLFSLLFFRWMNSVLRTGSERSLEEKDFLPLAKESTSHYLTKRLKKQWNNEKARCRNKNNSKKSKLWKSLLKSIPLYDLMLIISTSALYSLTRLLQPLLLGCLTKALMSAERQNNYLSYGYALGMGANALLGCIALHQYGWRCERLSIRISSALKGLVYLKVSKDKARRAIIAYNLA